MMGNGVGPGGKFNLYCLNNFLLTHTTSNATATSCIRSRVSIPRIDCTKVLNQALQYQRFVKIYHTCGHDQLRLARFYRYSIIRRNCVSNTHDLPSLSDIVKSEEENMTQILLIYVYRCKWQGDLHLHH
ncbi:hypothetical protein M758_5G060100 [Ceratodon purpureus]|nr:hypothetical protein M758_5G060100 [Ceratodon purpureus]